MRFLHGYMQPSSLDGSNTTCDGHLVFVVGIDVVGTVQQRREAQWHDCTECSMEHSIEHLIECSMKRSIECSMDCSIEQSDVRQLSQTAGAVG